MIVIHLKRGGSIEIRDGAAVTASTFPAVPSSTPAPSINVVTADGKVLTSFRQAEIAGADV